MIDNEEFVRSSSMKAGSPKPGRNERKQINGPFHDDLILVRKEDNKRLEYCMMSAAPIVCPVVNDKDLITNRAIEAPWLLFANRVIP